MFRTSETPKLYQIKVVLGQCLIVENGEAIYKRF